jgi:hypothetical protein
MVTAWILDTGFGGWDPLAWLAALAVITALVYAIRSLGVKDYKRDTDQTKPFISGNEVPPGGEHIRGGSLYWGYLEALKKYYEALTPLHNGVLADYVLWLTGVLAAVLVIALLA